MIDFIYKCELESRYFDCENRISFGLTNICQNNGEIRDLEHKHFDACPYAKKYKVTNVSEDEL